MTAPATTAPASASSTPAVKVTVTEGTEYVVLERKTDDTWGEGTRITARSASAAVRDAIAGDTTGGTFVAIPARSWKPVKVTPETVTTLKLEDVKT